MSIFLPKYPSSRYHSGFTLYEMALILSIMALVAIFVIPASSILVSVENVAQSDLKQTFVNAMELSRLSGVSLQGEDELSAILDNFRKATGINGGNDNLTLQDGTSLLSILESNSLFFSECKVDMNPAAIAVEFTRKNTAVCVLESESVYPRKELRLEQAYLSNPRFYKLYME